MHMSSLELGERHTLGCRRHRARLARNTETGGKVGQNVRLWRLLPLLRRRASDTVRLLNLLQSSTPRRLHLLLRRTTRRLLTLLREPGRQPAALRLLLLLLLLRWRLLHGDTVPPTILKQLDQRHKRCARWSIHRLARQIVREEPALVPLDELLSREWTLLLLLRVEIEPIDIHRNGWRLLLLLLLLLLLRRHSHRCHLHRRRRLLLLLLLLLLRLRLHHASYVRHVRHERLLFLQRYKSRRRALRRCRSVGRLRETR